MDPTELESLRSPPRPREYAGLGGIQSPAVGSHSPAEQLDQHGYLQVIADPDNGGQAEVCCRTSDSFTLVVYSKTYGDVTVFKMAAIRHLRFLKIYILTPDGAYRSENASPC